MSSNTKPGVNPNEFGHVTSKKRFLLKFYEIYPFQRKTVSKLTWLSPTVAHVTKPRDYIGYFKFSTDVSISDKQYSSIILSPVSAE